MNEIFVTEKAKLNKAKISQDSFNKKNEANLTYDDGTKEKNY